MSRTSGASDLVDLAGRLKAVTPMAILLLADDGPQAWLPRSQVEIDGVDDVGERVTVTMKESLAIEKGLV